MTRLILFVVILAAGALAFDWLADQPGEMVLTLAGQRVKMSLLVATVALIALIFAVFVVIGLVRMVLRSPRLAAQHMRERTLRKGREAMDRGLVAIGAGDLTTARRYAHEASRFAPDAPLTLLLQAQTQQLAGNRDGAERAFKAMLEKPETRVLGLRGLHVEAQRRNDPEAARALAAEAAKEAPAAAWAAQALLDQQCAQGEWDAALETVARSASARVVDKETARRQKAVLLTAKAMSLEASDPAMARKLAVDAHSLAPSLVPAATLAGRLMSANGETRKVTKLIETTWKLHPHPDLAEIYAHARSGDSALDRLGRVSVLAALAPEHPESTYALANAAIEAGEWAKAHTLLDPLSAERPSQRICLLLAALARGESDLGKAREWTARAVRAPRDPAWTADGQASLNWLPFSPVTGRIDAFEWKVPVTDLGLFAADIDLTLDEPAAMIEQLPETPADPVAETPPSEPAAEAVPANDIAFRPPVPDDPGLPPGTEPAKKRFSLFGG